MELIVHLECSAYLALADERRYATNQESCAILLEYALIVLHADQPLTPYRFIKRFHMTLRSVTPQSSVYKDLLSQLRSDPDVSRLVARLNPIIDVSLRPLFLVSHHVAVGVPLGDLTRSECYPAVNDGGK